MNFAVGLGDNNNKSVLSPDLQLSICCNAVQLERGTEASAEVMKFLHPDAPVNIEVAYHIGLLWADPG